MARAKAETPVRLLAEARAMLQMPRLACGRVPKPPLAPPVRLPLAKAKTAVGARAAAGPIGALVVARMVTNGDPETMTVQVDGQSRQTTAAGPKRTVGAPHSRHPGALGRRMMTGRAGALVAALVAAKAGRIGVQVAGRTTTTKGGSPGTAAVVVVVVVVGHTGRRTTSGERRTPGEEVDVVTRTRATGAVEAKVGKVPRKKDGLDRTRARKIVAERESATGRPAATTLPRVPCDESRQREKAALVGKSTEEDGVTPSAPAPTAIEWRGAAAEVQAEQVAWRGGADRPTSW